MMNKIFPVLVGEKQFFLTLGSLIALTLGVKIDCYVFKNVILKSFFFFPELCFSVSLLIMNNGKIV